MYGDAISFLTALGWISLFLSVFGQMRRIPFLADQPDHPPAGSAPPVDSPEGIWPSVRIVCAARNEAEAMEAAAGSWLGCDYPHIEFRIVDDRSTDATGRILDRLASTDPRLDVLHITKLPAGWLGKNHALHRGALGTETDWILFTDADVRFHPRVLRKAVAFAEREGIDHLAVGPGLARGHWFLMSVIAFFSLIFGLYIRPAKAADPRSPAHIGIGAFNLVRTRVYRAVGGHERIALRPDDDLKLGKLIKENGYRQRFAQGRGLLEVQWYPSVRAMARGLEKNVFSAFEYRLWRVLINAPIYCWMFYAPFLGLFLAPGIQRIGYAAAAAALLGVAALNRRMIDTPRGTILLIPLSATVFFGILVRAVLLTYLRGGIVWRDQFYPLADLRRNRI